MKTCFYKNEKWLIKSEIHDAYVILRQVQKTAFAIQYEQKIVNKSDVLI